MEALDILLAPKASYNKALGLIKHVEECGEALSCYGNLVRARYNFKDLLWWQRNKVREARVRDVSGAVRFGFGGCLG